MEVQDDAFVLSARAHGDTGAVVDLLTERHGRRAAYVAGGASRRMRPFLQPGARVVADLRSRTSDQLGSARLEPVGEGPAAVDEALRFLEHVDPVPPLRMAGCLNLAATRHARAKGSVGGSGVTERRPSHHKPCIGRLQANSAVAIAGPSWPPSAICQVSVKIATGGIKRTAKRVAVEIRFSGNTGARRLSDGHVFI